MLKSVLTRLFYRKLCDVLLDFVGLVFGLCFLHVLSLRV